MILNVSEYQFLIQLLINNILRLVLDLFIIIYIIIFLFQIAWNQQPTLRPNLPTFLNQLVCLYREHYPSHIKPRSKNGSIGSSTITKEILNELDDDDLSLDTLDLDDVPK